MRNNRVVKFYDELRKNVPVTDPGQRLNDIYKLDINEDGTKDLIVVDHIDTYEMIQSHKNSVDIHKIIEKCTITGDMSPLYKTEGFYGDLIGFPKTRAEALQMLNDAENIWSQLPVRTKEKFDNDVNKFFASAFTKEWSDKLELVKDVEKEVVEDEVKSNE